MRAQKESEPTHRAVTREAMEPARPGAPPNRLRSPPWGTRLDLSVGWTHL